MNSLTPDLFLSNRQTITAELERNWDTVPLWGINSAEGALVRWRGMVQDMMGNVFFYSQVEIESSDGLREVRSGMYRDYVRCEDNETVTHSGKTVTGEREVFFTVNIPAVNDWCTDSTGSSKRHPETADECTGAAKKFKLNDGSAVDGGGGGADTGSQYPIQSSATNSSAILQFYDSPNLKLNELVDVIGFVSYSGYESGDVCALSPQIHVLISHKLSSPYNPSIDIPLASFSHIRSDLHLVLSQVLQGDSLAAEYLLCYLISQIYMRTDYTVLGKFSLNLMNLKKGSFGQRLATLLSNLVPLSYYCPMNIHNLNSLNFVPYKDYETERLTSGLLQLPSGTKLILDETELETGRLIEKGVHNVHALSELIKTQSVSYDFKYFRKDFDAQIDVLVVSEGKSLLPTDFNVKIISDFSCSTPSELFDSAMAYLNEEDLLLRIRSYLHIARSRKVDFAFDDNLSDKIENDFVSMRRENVATTPDDLHRLLILARFLCLSYGENTLTSFIWEKAKEMEISRKLRL